MVKEFFFYPIMAVFYKNDTTAYIYAFVVLFANTLSPTKLKQKQPWCVKSLGACQHFVNFSQLQPKLQKVTSLPYRTFILRETYRHTGRSYVQLQNSMSRSIHRHIHIYILYSTYTTSIERATQTSARTNPNTNGFMESVHCFTGKITSDLLS